ncbi:MAG: AsmA-like C-terminal region-containing protein [Pseudomonadota bacterium]
MQTTLLGLAIAFIVALVAALVGPYFIDWSQFRPQFEAEASRIIGAPVRVGGKLDALLLPTPTLRLRSVAIGGDNDPGKVRADKLDVEFSLGSLMRGEWRASELSLDGFALDVGLDKQGRFDWPSSTGRFNLGTLAIDRLNLKGKLALRDAASGSTIRLDDLDFSGDVRALAGAIRGEGTFSLMGARTPFRISSGQSGDGKGTRVRLIVDPGERPLSADLDGVLTFDALTPKFDGALTLARPAGARSAASDTGLPWRLSSRVKASPNVATFEQLEAAYGSDENALRFTGGGELRFGAAPLLRVALSARQLDADRMLGKAAAGAEPLRVIAGLQRLVTALPSAPLPVQLDVSADQIALGGRPLQNVAVDLRADDKGWTLGKFEMRAPGATRVFAAGTIAQPGPSANFTGPVNIESADPDALIAWMQGRSDAAYRNQKPMRVRGNATVAADRTAIEGLTADINGGTIEGRLAVLTPSRGSSRFEATLKTARFDLDATAALGGMLAGPQADWPDEAQISLEAASAIFAGQEVRPAAIQFAYGPKTISLDRLQVGDASMAVAINGAGSFDRGDGNGKFSLSATAPSLGQIAGFIAPFAPAVSERLNAVAKVTGAARVQLSANIAKAPDQPDRMDARAVLDIDAPQIKGSATLTAAPGLNALRMLDLVALTRGEFSIETRLASDQTAFMLALLGLDRVVSSQDGPAQFESSVAGVWRSPLRLKAKLSGAGLDGDVQGTGDPWADQPKAVLAVAVRRADLSALFDLKPGRLAASAVSLSSRLGVSGNIFTFDDLDSTAGGSRVRGRLVLTRGDEIGIDGEIGMDTLDLAALTGLALGAAGRDPSEPLGRGWLYGWRGRLAFQALSAALPGGSELRPFSGAMKGDGQSLALENAKGGLGGGEVALDFNARQSTDNTAFNARVKLADADGAALRYRGLAMPKGQAALDMSLAGQGRSAAGLAGALSGAGSLTLKDARIAGLDPRAFEVAMRASDGGQATDDVALQGVVEPVLDAGVLTVPSAEIAFTIKDGRLRVETATLNAERARAVIAGGYDLLADQADIRAVMSPVTTRPIMGRPEIRVDLHGSPDRLARSIDVAALSSWLAIRAIDRETRRLDQLERGVTPNLESDDLWEEPLSNAEPIPPSEVKIPNRDPRRKSTKQKAVPAVAAPPVWSPQVPAPGSSSASQPQVQPLPPPIDIKPAPGAMRAPKPRPATGTF